jgi:hypothetical protein
MSNNYPVHFKKALRQLYELEIIWKQTNNLDLETLYGEETSKLTHTLWQNGLISYEVNGTSILCHLTKSGLEVICDKQLEIKYED